MKKTVNFYINGAYANAGWVIYNESQIPKVGDGINGFAERMIVEKVTRQSDQYIRVDLIKPQQ